MMSSATGNDRLLSLWAERDQHDATLKLDSVLCEEALERLDTAKEGVAPQSRGLIQVNGQPYHNCPSSNKKNQETIAHIKFYNFLDGP